MKQFSTHMADKKQAVGKRKQGRPSREYLGLDPIKRVTTAETEKVLNACVKKYGSLAAALRFAAMAKAS